MEIVGVIPARFASTRLPGKALLSETGRPLIQHVLEAARRAQSLERIIVATDDPRIAQAVERFGGEFMMTRADHATGTDRVAEVAARLERARVIVNLQGDEPEISGAALDRVVALLEEDAEAPMATLATPIRDESIYRDPACVKVVCSARGRALYFSRSPIPHHRDGLPSAAGCSSPDRLPAPGPLRLSPRIPAGTGLAAAFQARGRREARAASRARRRVPDRRRNRRRAERRHRYSRRLPPVRGALECEPIDCGVSARGQGKAPEGRQRASTPQRLPAARAIPIIASIRVCSREPRGRSETRSRGLAKGSGR